MRYLFIEVIKTAIRFLLLRFQNFHLDSRVIHQNGTSTWLILAFRVSNTMTGDVEHEYPAVSHHDEAARRCPEFFKFENFISVENRQFIQCCENTRS